MRHASPPDDAQADLSETAQKDRSPKPPRKARWRRIILFTTTALLVLGVVGYFVAANLLTRYLRSDDLRTRISRKTAGEFDGRGGYLPLSWRGLSVYSPGFLGLTEPPRALAELRATDLHAHCNFSQLWQREFRIDRLSIDRVQAAYSRSAVARLRDALPAQPALEPADKSDSKFALDLREVIISRTDILWGDAKASGAFRDVATSFYPNGGSMVVYGKGGTFEQAGWPEARLTSCQLYYAKPRLRIDEGSLTLGGKSLVAVTGAFEFGPTATIDLALQFQHTPIAPFLKEEWRSKFRGTFASETRLTQQFGAEGGTAAAGQIKFADAILQNIKGLEKVADFTGKREFGRLTLETLEGRFRWDAPTLKVEDLEMEARGLMRVEGDFTIREEQIAGTLQLGVTAAVLESFPGAREEVFTKSRGGYFWTTVKISGPVSKPREDLKPRLVAAAKKHIVKKLLSPILKPAEAIAETIEKLF